MRSGGCYTRRSGISTCAHKVKTSSDKALSLFFPPTSPAIAISRSAGTLSLWRRLNSGALLIEAAGARKETTTYLCARIARGSCIHATLACGHGRCYRPSSSSGRERHEVRFKPTDLALLRSETMTSVGLEHASRVRKPKRRNCVIENKTIRSCLSEAIGTHHTSFERI